MKKNALRIFIAMTSVSLLLGVQQNADAAIFKCVNAQGETYYNDKACPQTDKETQLNNVKDPVGGYIPPAFKADVKAIGSKGVVVGGNAGENSNNERSDDVSDSGNNSSDNNESSEANNSDDDAVGDEVPKETLKSASNKRTKPKGIRKKPLPTVPLKREIVTNEPRSTAN